MVKRVGLVGVTGYTGMELTRILLGHPHLRLTQVTSRKEAGSSCKRPAMRICTLFFIIVPISSRVDRSMRVMRPATSSSGRAQFSLENA